MPKQQRGCWFYGCITLAVLALLTAIGIYFAARYAIKKASGLMDQYTQSSPAPIDVVQVSSDRLKLVQDRVASFGESLAGRPGSRELVLTADDINALIQNDPQYKEAKGKVFVMLEDDQVKGKISIPLDEIGQLGSFLKGRYLNGTASLNVALENGSLSVRVKEVDVGGKPLPPRIIAEMQKVNFAQEVEKNPDARKSLDKLESIQVKDSKLLIRAKEQKP